MSNRYLLNSIPISALNFLLGNIFSFAFLPMLHEQLKAGPATSLSGKWFVVELPRGAKILKGLRANVAPFLLSRNFAIPRGKLDVQLVARSYPISLSSTPIFS